KRLRAVGEKVFNVIEAQPDRVREVDGIGPIRASRITAAWAEQKAVREIMVFQHSPADGLLAQLPATWLCRIRTYPGGHPWPQSGLSDGSQQSWRPMWLAT